MLLGCVYNPTAALEEGTIVSEKLTCDFDHQRRVPAVVKLEVKSTRATKAGHPMIRFVAICAAHARELRRLGLELVAG